MNILLLASHAVAEYDDIRMFTDLGYNVFCPGGYQNPRESGEGIRPPIPNAPVFPELIEACEKVRREMGDPGDYIDWAKAHLPDEVIDWADVIVAHHFVDRWVFAQWNRIKHKRVIWRTCGQSSPELEALMGRLDGLEIVRYSPKEAAMPNYAGQNALIRFGKYPADYGPWTGEVACVANVTQHMKQRGEACGYSFWSEATRGLYARPAGPGSEEMRGVGTLDYEAMLDYLRRCRVYLYTGTVAAPYTLGLMEAMLTGIPVVSIGPEAWAGPSELFEGHEITLSGHDNPVSAQESLHACLNAHGVAEQVGQMQRQRAIELFDVAHIGPQWRAVLG